MGFTVVEAGVGTKDGPFTREKFVTGGIAHNKAKRSRVVDAPPSLTITKVESWMCKEMSSGVNRKVVVSKSSESGKGRVDQYSEKE